MGLDLAGDKERIMADFDVWIIEKFKVNAKNPEDAVNQLHAGNCALVTSDIKAAPAGTLQLKTVQLDNSYLIIYMKVTENKKIGITFNGPFYGPIEPTEEEAKIEAQKIVNENKNCTVITKIFNVDKGQSHSDIMNTIAKSIFDRIKKDIVESRELLDKKRIKRKK